MTVTLKEEIADARSARNTEGSRAYTRAFRLETSLQSEGAYDVGSHVDLPVISDTHPSDANAYCFDINIENSDPWKGWIATYEYSDARRIDPTPGPGGLLDEILYSWTTQLYQKRFTKDRNGDGIVNKAGDPLPEPIYADKSRIAVSIEFNIIAVPIQALDYLDTINDGPIVVSGLGIPKNAARFMGMTVGHRQIRGVYPTGPLAGQLITYYPVSYELMIDSEFWKFFPENIGMRDLSSSQKKQVTSEADLEPVWSPVPLDENGVALPDPVLASQITFVETNIYQEANFSLLIGVD